MEPKVNREDCPVCHGTGRIRTWAGIAGDTVIIKCPECNGEGRIQV
jgi:DnaJ-class molecular chaperone